MSDIISLHCGQAGINMGMSCWELFCLEHDIGKDGFKQSNEESGRVVFAESRDGNHSPRAVFLDLEPTVMDEIRTGTFRELFHPDQLINGKEDASNNFARGYYTVGRHKVDEVLDRIRRQVECSDQLQGFLIFNSMAGGTGSGFTSRLVERLSVDYPKKFKVACSIVPSPQLSTAVVDPYNVTLATHHMFDHIDCHFLFDNESLYDINRMSLDVERPSCANLNEVLGKVVSSLTASFRFGAEVNPNMDALVTNLIPYPRVQFPLVSFAPLVSTETLHRTPMTVPDMTSACFKPSTQMMKCDPIRAKYMSCCVLYAGDVAPRSSRNVITRIQQQLQFVRWCPPTLQVGFNLQPIVDVPDRTLGRSPSEVCCAVMNTAMAGYWARLDHQFDLMYRKRAFVHWYVGEGMEEGELGEAREDLVGLEQDYKELDDDINEWDDEDEEY